MDELKNIVASLQTSKVTERRTSIVKLQQFVERLRKNGSLDQIERKHWSKVVHAVFIPALTTEIAHQFKNKNPQLKKNVTEPLKIVIKCLVECIDDEQGLYFEYCENITYHSM
jgi:hypothetical protein